jgi:glutaredoxin
MATHPGIRCPACGHTRTRLDPLPDTHCPDCGVSYAQSQRNVELGLLQPVNDAPPPGRPAASGFKTAAVGLTAMVVVAAGWYFLLVPADSRESTAQANSAVLKGSIAAAAQPEVVMFATSWCPYCATARRFFQGNGIQYTEYDIEKDAAAKSAYSKLGGGGVPVIVIAGSAVHGYNERQLTSLLQPWLGKRGG